MKERFAFGFRIVGFMVGLSGIVLHMLADNIVPEGFMVRHKLAYFTIQTNVFVVILFGVLLYRTYRGYKKDKQWHIATVNPKVQMAVTLYISMTMLGFWLLLAPTTGISRNPFIFMNSLTLHLITPLFAIVDFVWFGMHGQVTKRDVKFWLSYPAAYVVFVMLYSKIIQTPYYSFKLQDEQINLKYPYPFLDANVIGVWGVVFSILGLAVVFYLLGRIFVFLDNKKRNSFK